MRNNNPGKRPKAMSGYLLIALCLIVFCGSAAYLLLYSKDKVEAENGFHKIRESSYDLTQLYGQNSDLIGWIRIEGTRIDYPVMQTPDDPEYYLYRDFNKEYSASGTPFMDATCIAVRKQSPITWNWIIYGHNMKFGTMFHDLQKYESKAFWEKHRNFSFDVYDPETGTTDHGEYQIFAAGRSKVQAEDSAAFGYYRYAGYSDEKTFYEYIGGLKEESIYDTGISPVFGEQIVTLSTCAYHMNRGRFYIVGRKISERR